MLNPANAIRTERRLYTDGSPYTACIFLCIDCGKEIAPASTDCHCHAGRCRTCANKASHRKRPFESRWNTSRLNAEARGLVFALSYEDYLLFTKQTCHYCKQGLDWEPFGQIDRSNLDRKSNALGYSVSNCVACCYFCNILKGNRLTYLEMVELAPALERIQINRNKIAVSKPQSVS